MALIFELLKSSALTHPVNFPSLEMSTKQISLSFDYVWGVLLMTTTASNYSLFKTISKLSIRLKMRTQNNVVRLTCHCALAVASSNPDSRTFPNPVHSLSPTSLPVHLLSYQNKGIKCQKKEK